MTESNGLRRSEILGALSLAADLGMGHPTDLGLRTCVVAVRLARALGANATEVRETYDLALLRFSGCTADSDLAARAFGDEIVARGFLAPADFGRPSSFIGLTVRNIRKGEPAVRRARAIANVLAHTSALFGAAQAHCEVAQRLAARLGFDSRLQKMLGEVFERWDGKGIPKRLRGDAVSLPVRIVTAAHDAEIYFRLGGIEAAIAMRRERSGGAHEPRVVQVFCRHAGDILGAREESTWDAALEAEPLPAVRLTPSQLDAALEAMGDFSDLKSRYTSGHSSGVAALARKAGELQGLDAVELGRAAFVQDLGRVGVSAGVWDKPGPLTDAEWEKVRLHPYLGDRCLTRSKTLAALSAIAALHHERLDGSGYHRGLPAGMLPSAARTLAAADAYHAMLQPRAYRPAFRPAQAADALRRDAQAGRLCLAATDAVLAAAGHATRRPRALPAGLTDREVEVLRLVARGHTAKETGSALGISAKTVDHHIQHIYGKIGVSTRAAATLFAIENRLLNE